MSAWSGLLFIAGAIAGYAVFMGVQPGRGVWARGYRAARDYPCLWLIAGVFETVRLTVATVHRLATGAISADAFVSAWPVGLLPFLRELLVPAADAALVSLLKVTTYFIDAWPMSVALAVCLIGNVGGALRQLWVSPDGKGRISRWSFTVLAVVAAVVHLLDVGVRTLPLPAAWIGMLTPLHEEILRSGSQLFSVGCGVAIQVWLVLWVVRSLEPRFDGVSLPEAAGRLGSFFLLILVYAGARTLWGEIDLTGWERVVLVVAFVAAFFVLPVQVRVLSGECGLIPGLARHGPWILRNFESAFWWLATAAVHLFLLHVCDLGMSAVFGELSWAAWCWGVFFSFFKAGIYVWLLSAFVILVEESLGKAHTRPVRKRRQ